MIADDQFEALVAVLVDCGAVPACAMATVIRGLADSLIAKAKGSLHSDWQVYPAELFDRARNLDQLAAELSRRAANA